MKRFTILLTAVSLWISVTATPQGYMEGIERLDHVFPGRNDAMEYQAELDLSPGFIEKELARELHIPQNVLDRSNNKGRLTSDRLKENLTIFTKKMGCKHSFRSITHNQNRLIR